MSRALRAMAKALVLLVAAALLLPPIAAPRSVPLRTAAAPTTTVLQPDAQNGTDTSLFSLTPSWNFGDNATLTVGPNQTTGDVARSLLSFDLNGFPSNAVVVNATLRLFADQGGGQVQVRRVVSPWTEGAGGHSWAVVPVTVRETAGVNRTLEPVRVTIPFLPNAIMNPARDLRVYLGGAEVPSQVYREQFSGGKLASADVYFDVTLGAYQSRVYEVVYSTNGTAVPSYRTQGFGARPVWTSEYTGGGASGATIADIDGDGRLEVVFGSADGYVYCLYANGTTKWKTLVSLAVPPTSIQFTPQVADVDHSGRDSIFAVTNDASVVRLDDAGHVVWRYNSTPLLFSGGTLVDVNGDGVLDFLTGGNTRQVIALDGVTGTLLPISYAVGGAGYWPTIADIDGSGSPEVLFTGYDKNVHAYALDGNSIWTNAPNGAAVFENALAFGDLYGNGVNEVVTGDFGNNGIAFALYGKNGSVAWSTPIGNGFVSGLSLGDLNGDGQLEVVMGGYPNSMYAIRANGQPFWPAPYVADTSIPGSPALVDVTNSGSPNVIYTQAGSLVVLDSQGGLVQRWPITPNNQNVRGDQFTMANPAIADLTGNGTLDIIVPTGNGMQAYSTGGLDYDWRTWGYNLNHTQRALDGASGTGAPLLTATVGSTRVYPAVGASWNYEDGATPWSVPGSDFGSTEAIAAGTAGWMSWNITSLVQDWISGAYLNDGLILMESSEVAGTLHSFVSSDSPLAALRPELSVTYVSIAGTARPEILGPIPDVSMPENSLARVVDLTAYVNVSATPLRLVRWNVTGYDASVVQFTGLNVEGNSNLTIVPQADRAGSFSATYWLSDPQGRYDRQDAWINITPVNQPPTFTPPTVLYVQGGQTYTFDFGPYISDPDTPRAALVLTGNDTTHAVVSGFNVSFTYPIVYNDSWAFVNLTVSDGEFSVSRIIAVHVGSDAPPIVTTPLPDVTLYQGETKRGVFYLGDHFADPDPGILVFSAASVHLNVTVQANSSVDFRAPLDWWGAEPVTFRATDRGGAFTEDTITVTVLHIDQPPSIAPLPNLRVRFDVPYSFNLDPYLSDPDTPLNQLVVTATDPHVFVSGHLLTFLYPGSYNNTYQAVVVFVSDGTLSANRAIIVAVGADLPPALLKQMPDVSFPEGTVLRDAYDLTTYFADPDGSALYWSSGNKSVLVTIHGTGTVDLAAAPRWHGTERVTFRATDSQGALQEDSVWITVTPVNQAPYFLPVPDQHLNRTAVYLPLSAYLRDPDTNLSDLILVATSSSHATIIGQGILLSYAQDMTETIRIDVSDGSLTNATTIRVMVLLPGAVNTVTEILPWWLAWVALAAAVASFGGFVVYRRRQLEWAFLVTNNGLLVGSVSRRGLEAIDTDLMTGMLTTIMDFARKSFSDERERNLEGLELGEKRVSIVRGEHAYVAVVYRGRTPGRLLPIMRSFLDEVEREHADALGDIVDTSRLGDIPQLLQRLVTRGNLPFVGFKPANS